MMSADLHHGWGERQPAREILLAGATAPDKRTFILAEDREKQKEYRQKSSRDRCLESLSRLYRENA